MRLCLPADKSLSHRAAIFGCLEPADITISNFLTGEDCLSTLSALRSLGVRVEIDKNTVRIISPGIPGLQMSPGLINAGNSGTTARLLLGLLSGVEGMVCDITGDASLRSRPMVRVEKPLEQMGLSVKLTDGQLPARVVGKKARGSACLKLDKASAQVKSALMLAAYASNVDIKISLPAGSRDHTENIFHSGGVKVVKEIINSDLEVVSFAGSSKMNPQCLDRLHIPADPSSAAIMSFMALLSGNNIHMERVLNNPNRNGFFKALEKAGAPIGWSKHQTATGLGEFVSDLSVNAKGFCLCSLRPLNINEEKMVASSIDELPLLILMSMFIEGSSCFGFLDELRVKESDRLKASVNLLEQLGANYQLSGSQLVVYGRAENLLDLKKVSSIDFDALGDHRFAMIGMIITRVFGLTWPQKDEKSHQISFPSFLENMTLMGYGN